MRLKTMFIFMALSFGAAVAALNLDFARRTEGVSPAADIPRTAIVFTGALHRVRLGLDLLEAGRVDYLFVSGANWQSGVPPERFAEQFALTARQIEALEEGRIALASDAQSTLENALETRCWLERTRPDTPAVTLITSPRHMPRASRALARAIAPTQVTRLVSYPAPGSEPGGAGDTEFADFVATWAITLLPLRFWPADRPTNCRAARSGSLRDAEPPEPVQFAGVGRF